MAATPYGRTLTRRDWANGPCTRNPGAERSPIRGLRVPRVRGGTNGYMALSPSSSLI